jgi:hypothetical protein
MTDITTVQTFPSEPEIQMLVNSNNKLKEQKKSLMWLAISLGCLSVIILAVHLHNIKQNEKSEAERSFKQF